MVAKKGGKMDIQVFYLCYFLSQTAKPQDGLPAFQLTDGCGASMCIKVAFADGQNDIIAADEYHGERHPKHDVFKGHLLSAQTKAVVILGQDGKEDLIVFKSKKVHGCRKYNVDLEVNRGQYRSITITFCQGG